MKNREEKIEKIAVAMGDCMDIDSLLEFYITAQIEFLSDLSDDELQEYVESYDVNGEE